MAATLPKIVFFGSEDWFFLSHRVNLGRACLKKGWRVTVAARVQAHGDQILAEGFQLASLRLRRGGMNPAIEFGSLVDIFRVFARERPDIVHLVGLKLILYGVFVSLFFPRTIVVSAVSGLGTLFTTDHTKASLIRKGILFTLPRLLRRKNQWVIVQNNDDALLFQKITSPERVVLIPGAGVDIDHFSPGPEPEGIITAAIVSRMLGEKGVNEVVAAARVLRERGVAIRIQLVGTPDPENPTSISEETLQEWHNERIIEWHGHRSDIAEVWAQAHIAVLPSYREGFPKSLIEAMASRRPAITTDTIGCREVIEDGVSGILVPVYDSGALADALQKLVEDKVLRREMGRAARERTEALFSDGKITSSTLDLYGKAIETARRSCDKE
jgi:glycosyltransferase involved in cell wall biosynthesis